MTTINIMNDTDPFWQQVHASDAYSIYHTEPWKNLIEETFKHSAMYLSASNDEILIDVLPLFLIKKPFLGRKLVSTPYEACYGGFSCNDPMVRKVLVIHMKELALDLKVKYLEIRSMHQLTELNDLGFIEKRPFFKSELPLVSSDANWNMLSSNHRRNVRYADKRGVVVEIASHLSEMKLFYKILATHYRQLGIPFFDENFFIQIWHELIKEDHASLLLSKYKNRIMGGHLLFHSGNTLISKYSACKKSGEYNKLYASYALLWEGIRLGINHKYKYFNMGIVDKTNKGLLNFKSRFGAQNHPTYFYYYPISGRIPDYSGYLNSYSLLKKLWRATPMFFSSRIGQKIIEWIC